MQYSGFVTILYEIHLIITKPLANYSKVPLLDIKRAKGCLVNVSNKQLYEITIEFNVINNVKVRMSLNQ
jgi:hypothetical protein